MNRRFINMSVVALVAAASSTASVAHGKGGQEMDACIQHFVAMQLTDFHGKVEVQKASAGNQSPLARYDDNVVTVKALDGANGAILASVTCRVDRHNNVISMKPDAIGTSKLAERIGQESEVAKN